MQLSESKFCLIRPILKRVVQIELEQIDTEDKHKKKNKICFILSPKTVTHLLTFHLLEHLITTYLKQR